MKQKLRNYIFSAFLLNVFAIVSIGGLSILMVRAMVSNISELEGESGHISRIYDMNNRVQEKIFLVQTSFVDLDEKLLEHASSTIEEVRRAVAFYKYEEINKNEVELLFGKIESHLAKIAEILNNTRRKITLGQPVDRTELKEMESLGYRIQNLMEAINSVHFKSIRDLVSDSNTKVYYILFLFLTSSLVGIMASGVAYIVLARNTIMPIIDLATATEKVASGDLGVRVKTGSHTEIGTLYSTFNTMTEKLQEQQQQQDNFSFELEMMVEKRTDELRSSKESLRKTQADLMRVEKIATIGHIATAVNHEVKTPLNVLSMNLQLLNKKIKKCTIPEEKQKDNMLETIAIIDNEVSRINEIIEEFVTYARFPAPDFKENDISKIITDIGEMVYQSAKKANVSVEIGPDENLPPVLLDEKKIIQALLNLCMNGIQAMPDGGTLRLGCTEQGGGILITIEDNGNGISPSDLKQIFEPFFTKKEKGTGFGLAIVQRIVEDHGGQITCHSELGQKTVFAIFLPLKTNTGESL